jgi:hypothetical protein
MTDTLGTKYMTGSPGLARERFEEAEALYRDPRRGVSLDTLLPIAKDAMAQGDTRLRERVVSLMAGVAESDGVREGARAGEVLKILQTGAKDQSESVRSTAVAGAGLLGLHVPVQQEEAFAMLEQASRDKSDYVRAQVMRYAGGYAMAQPEKVLKLAAAGAKDESPRVRQLAEHARRSATERVTSRAPDTSPAPH